ncbi:hypothetical protein PMG11_11206 [Penicillium brasilianum]|uniref:RING-type domain-containing protein n=1 Tax=Penicillium brasilianum TaxID=104259 RepID=A0A0F7U161_PENBI|nr:hypothetical protein PMG11_11206 [Penicillium brasilianum]
MSYSQDWDRFTNGMGVSLATEARICCGTTTAGAPCKNSIKFQDFKTGQQQLANFAAQPFEFLTLRSTLNDIARNFLCARWHRQRQADQLGQQWYEAVVRSREHARHTSEVAAVAPDIEADQSQRSTFGRQTDPVLSSRATIQHEDESISLVRDPAPLGPSERICRYVMASMLRTNSAPWCISPAQPATLSGFNIGAGMQNLELHSLTLSDEVSAIYCPFCLGDDEEYLDESVILRCNRCRGLAHLSCVEEWLEKRDAGPHVSCCACRSDGALDALLRSPRARANPDPASEDAEIHAALLVERSDATDSPHQSGSGRLPVQSVSSPHRRALCSTTRSVRRSARLAENNTPRRSPRLNRT